MQSQSGTVAQSECRGVGHPCQIQAPNPIPAAPACVMHVIRNGVNPAIICNAGVRTARGLHLRIAGFRARYVEKDVGRSNSGPSGLGSWVSIWGLGVQKASTNTLIQCIFLCLTTIHAVHGTRLLSNTINHSPPFDIYRRSTYQSCSRSSALLP